MSGFESAEAYKSPQDTLKEELLAGKITTIGFGEKLLELDQSTPARHEAFANYNVLTDKEVIAFAQAEPIEMQIAYNRILGFTEFHIAQIKALEDNNAAEALTFFKASLQHGEQGGEDEEWMSYVTATVAYFERDIEKLKKAFESPEMVIPNRTIVENMIRGLQERGSVNYREDYRAD